MSQLAAKEKNVTLLDILDRILEKGVTLTGDITLSVADVDLVYVGLRALLASISTIERTSGIERQPAHYHSPAPTPIMKGSGVGCQVSDDSAFRIPHSELSTPAIKISDIECQASDDSAFRIPHSELPTPNYQPPPPVLDDALPQRINADPEGVEQGLTKLVLTLIELLRQLMERQALKRVEDGSLTDEEIERLGDTFQKLQSRMDELKIVFGLEGEDLNLNLGPLGDLL